jgi:SAM-dependent methyltransferase
MTFDRRKLTVVGHGDRAFWTPIDDAHAESVLAALALPPGARVLDLGCGRAEMLIRLCERGARGVGVDENPHAMAIARAEAARRLAHGGIELHEMDGSRFETGPGSLDAALCIAATHARGGLESMLAALVRWVRPGGRLAIGEGYWKRPPDPEYLAAIDATADEMTDLDTLRFAFTDRGLRVVALTTANEVEWRAYEESYYAAVERHAATHPDDAEALAMRDHVRRWNASAMRWGLDTMGLAYVVAEV